MEIGAQHILGDGRLESHDDALTRLLAELNIGVGDLFRSHDELIVEAYARRGQQIAYVKKEPSSKESVFRAQR